MTFSPSPKPEPRPPKKQHALPRESARKIAARKAGSRPWRMCRTCHRSGTGKALSQWTAPCRHALLPIGTCGQCGARRPLVECHHYNFRPALRRGGNPVPKRNPVRAAKKAVKYRKGMAEYRKSVCYKAVELRAGGRCEQIFQGNALSPSSPPHPRRCLNSREDGWKMIHNHLTYSRFGGDELPEDIELLCEHCNAVYEDQKRPWNRGRFGTGRVAAGNGRHIGSISNRSQP